MWERCSLRSRSFLKCACFADPDRGCTPAALVPVGVAVVTAHITMAMIQHYIVRKRKLEMQEE